MQETGKKEVEWGLDIFERWATISALNTSAPVALQIPRSVAIMGLPGPNNNLPIQRWWDMEYVEIVPVGWTISLHNYVILNLIWYMQLCQQWSQQAEQLAVLQISSELGSNLVDNKI